MKNDCSGRTGTRPPSMRMNAPASRTHASALQGYLASKKTHPPSTLQLAHAEGLMGVLGGREFSYQRGTPVHVPLPSEEGTTEKDSRTLTWKPGPAFGLDCLMCHIRLTAALHNHSKYWPRTAPWVALFRDQPYRGTSHTRKRTPLGPYRRPMPRVLEGP